MLWTKGQYGGSARVEHLDWEIRVSLFLVCMGGYIMEGNAISASAKLNFRMGKGDAFRCFIS
jgi:hypothetical protein